MRTLNYLLLVAGLSAGGGVLGQGWKDTAASVDRILDRYKAEEPGAELAISRGGQLLYSSVRGQANLEDGVALTRESRLEAGSVSKQFTAACILLLAQDGKLSLSDDIRKYLPEIPDYGHVITIGHLMHHTSGVRDWGSVAELAGWQRGSKAYTNFDALHIICQQRALNNVPGDEFIYSNSNYNLMAIIILRVSGQTLADFSRQRIFIPAGMSHTEWRDDYKRVVPGRAVAYSRGEDGKYFTQMPNEFVYGNGGLLTTAEDLLRWEDFYQHGRLGGPSLLARQLEKVPFNNGRMNIYTAGLFVDSVNGEAAVMHDGATAGYRANLDYFPRLGLTIAWLSNNSYRESTRTPGMVRDLFVPPLRATALGGAAGATSSGAVSRPFVVVSNRDTLWVSPADTSLSAAALQAYAGEYYSDETEAPMHIVVGPKGRLVMFPRMGYEQVMKPIAKGVFLMDGGAYVRFLDGGFEVSISRARKVRFKWVSAQTVKAPEPVGPLPNEAQLQWHAMEMNAFIHFTVNTFTDKEWGFGDESPAIFNPSGVDAGQWANELKLAGFKGVILTSKHHDGFTLWPSKYTDHSIKASPYLKGKGDIVKDLSVAARKAGLKFGIYLSPWDRNRADYGTPSYITYYRNQLKELFAKYGPVFEMWFDGANGGDGYYGGAREKRKINGATFYDWPGTLKMVDSLQPSPKVIFFSDAGPGVRWVGNERGLAGRTNWNTITPDTLYAGKAGIEDLLNTGSADGTAWIPAEVDVSIRPGWFYHASEDSKVKTPEELFEIYLSSVGRGSNLLLNVPPDRAGRFHDNDVAALHGFRKLLDERLGQNLAKGAAVTASATRGNDARFGGANLTDSRAESYWATDDGVTEASFVVDLGAARPVNFVLLQEYIRLGQRVKGFTIEAEEAGGWKLLAEETTIGYKRIVKVPATTTSRIRVRITSSKACPVISNVEIY